MQRSQSLFERTIANPSYAVVSIGVAVILLAIPLVIALWTNDLEALSVSGQWRGLLVAPVMILYIVLVALGLEFSCNHLYESLRSGVLMSDAVYKK
jgi:hypothetical protein